MDLGEVDAVEQTEDGVRLSVRTTLTSEVSPGDSVAVNGVCLTATAVQDDAFAADVMNETLRRSSLKGAGEGARVNVELPLRPADRLGGARVEGGRGRPGAGAGGGVGRVRPGRPVAARGGP